MPSENANKQELTDCVVGGIVLREPAVAADDPDLALWVRLRAMVEAGPELVRWRRDTQPPEVHPCSRTAQAATRQPGPLGDAQVEFPEVIQSSLHPCHTKKKTGMLAAFARRQCVPFASHPNPPMRNSVRVPM